MMNITPEAERTWNAFLTRVQTEAKRSGLDAADLSSSLDEHLHQVAKESETIDQTRVLNIIEELRVDLDSELNSATNADTSHQWRPIAISLGLFILAILTFPLVGPLLVIPSWIISRVLARNASQDRNVILFPALTYSFGILAAGILALSYLPTAILADAGILSGPWTIVLLIGLLLIWTALTLWIIRWPGDLTTILFEPLDSYVRRFVSPRLPMVLFWVGGVVVVAGIAGAINAA